MHLNKGFIRLNFFLCSTLLYLFMVLEYYVSTACEPKNPQIVGVQKKLKRSVPHFFSVNVVPCTGEDELYYKWEIHSKGHGNVQFPELSDNKPVYKFDGYRLNSLTNKIFELVFVVKLEISHYSDFSDSSTTSKQFLLTPDEMYLEIEGGAERTHSVSHNLVLDATPSKDFSFTKEEKPFFGNKINWRSSPELPSGAGAQAGLVWSIPSQYFNPGDVYDFILKVDRSKILWYQDTKEINQKVTFLQMEIPDLKLQCIRNCLDPNPEESTLFKVNCVENCDELYYKWEVTPDASDIEFGNGYDQLLIKAKVFKPNQDVKVVVKSGEFANSMMKLHFMPELDTGQCSIDPKTGISAVTNFIITCTNFKSFKNGELRYNVYMKGKGENKILLRSSPNPILSNIILSEGSIELIVLVRDTYYMKGEVELTVEVTPFSFSLGPEDTILNVLKRMVLMKLGDLKNLKTQKVEAINVAKNFDGVIQTSSIVLDVLEQNTPENEEENVKHDILKHVLESVYELNVVSLPSARQVLSFLQKYYEKKDKLKVVESPPYLAQLVSKSLLKVSQALFNAVSDPREIFITTTYVNEMATDISKVWSEVIEEYSIKITKWASLIYPEYQYYESYEELESSKFWLELNKRRILEDMIESVELLGKSISHSFVPNQKPEIVETDRLILTVERLHTKVLPGKNFPDSPASHVIIPEILALDLQNRFGFVDLQFAVLKMNGKLFQPAVVTETVIFNLIGDRKEKILQTNHGFDIHLKILESNRQESDDSNKFLEGLLKQNSVRVHSVKVEHGNMVKIIFYPVDGEIKVKLSSCYPKLSEVENSGMKMTPDSDEQQRTLTFGPDENEKMIYIGIASSVNLKYSAKVQTFSCGYWDSPANEWRKTFCRPKNLSEDFIICGCSHASLFAGEFFVLPNKLNSISDVNFMLSLRKNPLVAITVGLIVLIWIVLMIWAKIKDDRLNEKNHAVVLEDNVPGDRCPYLIVFFTGVHYDASTTADVGFQVIGSLSESRIHVILKPDENDWLKRGSDDWFVFFTPEKLGEMLKIRIWHNCRGSKPHWFCDRIVVQDLRDHPKKVDPYFFEVQSWFSLIWGDGKIHREFRPVPEKNSKKVNIAREILFNIRDKHLWFSVWARPTQSNFTCKERVSSAISFLMLSMLVSAMFYGVSTSKSASVDSQSSFSVTWRQFMIVAQTMVITVPVSMVISFLFRNSAPKQNDHI